jgi:hypothetical protein
MTRSALISLLKFQMCHDPGRCGLRSRESQHVGSVWFLVPTLSSENGVRDRSLTPVSPTTIFYPALVPTAVGPNRKGLERIAVKGSCENSQNFLIL